MRELYNIINEFDVRMTDNRGDDTENTGLNFEKEFGPDRYGKSMQNNDISREDDIYGGNGIESAEHDKISFDDDDDDDDEMNYDGNNRYDSRETDYDDQDNEDDDDMFAGEKRTDITHKLIQMLQNRGMYKDLKGDEDENRGEDLPDLDNLDLELSSDSDYEEDEEDPDFDYSAFSGGEGDEEEFNFDLGNR